MRILLKDTVSDRGGNLCLEGEGMSLRGNYSIQYTYVSPMSLLFLILSLRVVLSWQSSRGDGVSDSSKASVSTYEG